MKLGKTKKCQWVAAFATTAGIAASFAGNKIPQKEIIIDTGLAVSSGNGAAAITTARTSTRDVGDRLFRMRAGLRPMETQVESVAPAPSAKGGMSKMTTTTTATRMRCWEVYGSLFYYTENQDRQAVPFNIVGANQGIRLVHPGTDVDIFGGTIGIERHFSENWSAGFAVTASETDVDMTFVGNSDIDSLALTPYISYYRANAMGAADFWADLMYSHGFHEFDIRRVTFAGLASGSPDADTDQLEFTTGLNYGSGNVTHGPYAGLRWIDGSIDGYTEPGPAGGLFPEQDIESLVSVLGYQLSFPMQMGGGTLVPQIRGAWEHEFEDDANRMFGLPLGERDEDTAVLGAGVGYYGNSGWNTVLNYEARLSSNIEGHYISLKVGKEF